jgi:hypothetical protein
MIQIHHKKNELLEVEFYQDKECTEAYPVNSKVYEHLSIDFKCDSVYLELKNGDITPLCSIPVYGANIFIGYIPKFAQFSAIEEYSNKIKTLDDVTFNLSKYIPEDSAVLFLSEEMAVKYGLEVKHVIYSNELIYDRIGVINNDFIAKTKITIFLPHGTQSELQKANEVGKYLWENFGIKPNLCVLHWFGSKYEVNAFEIEYLCESFGILSNINKIITTNSTGISPVDDKDRLQIIDCKEIFQEYLKENN